MKKEKTKRVFTAKTNQIVIIPTVGISWNDRKILLSLVWLNVGCSIILINRKK